MSNTILRRNRATAFSTPGPNSPAVWDDCPWEAIQDGTVDGMWNRWDFSRGVLMPTITTIVSVNEWLAFGSAGFTFAASDFPGGGLCAISTTADDAFSLTTKCAPYRLSNVSGSFWMEGRDKLLNLTTLESSFLLGLMDTTAQTAISPLAADGSLADVNLVGFHKPAANTTKIDTSYKSNGNAIVEVNSDVGTLVAAAAANASQTLANYTTGYVNLGMKFNSVDKKLRFYIDNVEQATSKTIVDALGTTFPSDIGLRPVWACLCAAGSDQEFTIQGMRCAQLL